MTQLVECIPNFSEARRPEVVDEIAAAITSVDGARLLDRSSDLDHNRSVLSFAGSPVAVEEAAFRAIKRAAELIDLNQHTGEHPRIGATDVVPFVPLSGLTMEECISMARRLGERVGVELQIPVYLYERAASRPERANLEDLRRGQFEGLKAEIGVDPTRTPDFGPARLGPAGATVIGARDPLVAFNVYLATDDVEVARRIAKAIRQSSGGLRFVKALGLLVDGRAQVSMNLTDFRRSPMARVVEIIRLEAGRHGTTIHHSELVGLIPQEALVDAAIWYLQLDGFTAEQVLESRLYGIGARSSESSGSPETFVDRVAAPTAAPGGGSVAAYAGSLGAALVEMVAGLTIGKPKYQPVEAEMRTVLAAANALRAELMHGVEEDAAAYGAVMEAYRLSKETLEQKEARDQAIQRAMLAAARVPLQTAICALQVMELALQCARAANVNAISDAVSGAAMARAALTAAGYNVRINLHDLAKRQDAVSMLEQLRELESQADSVDEEIRQILAERENGLECVTWGARFSYEGECSHGSEARSLDKKDGAGTTDD